MKLCSMPQNFRECVALACGMVPTPLMDTLMGLLLAKAIIAATTIGIFDALEAEPLTAAEIAQRCGSDTNATERLVRALFACKYLKYENNHFKLAPVSRRWLPRKASRSLHSAILHRSLDLRFMNFEEYVRHGKSQEFHSALSPEEWGVYHRGQADHAAQIMDEVIERIALPTHATDLLDLGGGHGLYSVAFCGRYPNLRARVLDLATTVGELEAKRAPDSEEQIGGDIADQRPRRHERGADDRRGADKHRPETADADPPQLKPDHQGDEPEDGGDDADDGGDVLRPQPEPRLRGQQPPLQQAVDQINHDRGRADERQGPQHRRQLDIVMLKPCDDLIHNPCS